MNDKQMLLPAELKLKTNIVQVVSQRVLLKRTERGYMGSCPFHQQVDLSFHVFTDQQTWQCFGPCDTGGDVLSFVMRAEDVTFGEACRKLAIQCGIVQMNPAGGRLGELINNSGQMNPANGTEGRRPGRRYCDIVTVGDLLDMGAALTEKTLCGCGAPDDPVAYEAWLRLLRTQAGESDRQQREEAWSAERSRRFSEIHRERDLLDVSNAIVVPIDKRGQIKNDRDAPDDPMEYVDWLRRNRQLLERRMQSPFTRGYYGEDSNLVLGNLGYQGRVVRRRNLWRGGLLERKQPRPGLIVALHTTLQGHCRLEFPDYQTTGPLDTAGIYNAGEIIWTDSSRATAIVKDLGTGDHEEIPLKGWSTRGFCLIQPPRSQEWSWVWPREPEEIGGADRPFYYPSGEIGSEISVISLESFSLEDDGLQTSYVDLSGVTVEIRPPQRSLLSHRDHPGASH